MPGPITTAERAALASMAHVDHTAEMFNRAMERAKAKSIADRCTVHVCASLGVRVNTGNDYGLPYFAEFVLSDWFDGSTVASWTNGQRD